MGKSFFLPFQFKIENLTSVKKSLVDYIFPIPDQVEKSVSEKLGPIVAILGPMQETPNDRRAIGLAERLTSTIKPRLACNKK